MRFVSQYKRFVLGVVFFLFVGIAISALFIKQDKTTDVFGENKFSREAISHILVPYLETQSVLPKNVQFSSDNSTSQVYNLKYTLDEKLQKSAEDLLKRYKPDYSAIFMMDAKTGKVLIYSSYQKEEEPENLLKKATYPAASIFKIVTATTAIDKKGLSPQHKIQFNGGNWTLYKKNVMLDTINRWTRTVSFREAFAKSMNTPFGKIGLNFLEPQDLSSYAERFMFNKEIPSDFPVDKGIATIPDEKNYELTEVAAGFNKQNCMSPVQGAMIAASVINGGQMIAPYMVETLTNQKNEVIYQGSSLALSAAMAPATSEKIRELMEETIISGTSRRSFSSLRRDKKFNQVEMGGKTGHLTGQNPKGQVDWFVGYASNGDRRVAIGVVTVNKKFWTVKSSYLGQSLFKKAFEDNFEIAKFESIDHK